MIVAHTYAIWPSRTGFELYCPLGLVIIIMRVVIIINRDYFRHNYDSLLMKRHYIIIQILHWTPLPVTVSLWSCSRSRTCRSRSGTAVGLGHGRLISTSWVISWTFSCVYQFGICKRKGLSVTGGSREMIICTYLQKTL